VARAKQTDRAEARRRYRQASAQDPAIDDEIDGVGDDAPVQQRPAKAAPPKAASRQQPQPNARPGITSAFRAAYHPAHFREDFAALPRLLRHYAFLAPLGMIVLGTVVASIFWNYTGGQLAWQILVSPGSGFGLPQLVTGFFAPRASYMLGFIVSVIQGVAATIFVLTLSKQLGQAFPSEQIPGLLVQAFLAGPVSGTLFAAAAAWYRRFLALSGPKRTATNTRGQSRSANRGGARR
jgi:hypothetical protein